MDKAGKVGDLEIHQDLAFEARNWRLQRLGWMAMAVFILAGLLGLLGRGPLASARAASAGGLLQVEDQRFARHGSPAELWITVAPKALGAGPVAVVVSRPFLQGLEMQAIEPPPASAVAGGDEVVYTFNVDRDTPARILFRVIPDRYLWRHAEIRLRDARDRVHFRQFVFP